LAYLWDSDNDEPNVAYPFNLFSEVGGAYDWNIGTIPQTQLNGNSRPLPAGHVVGGGSIINGMVWNRGEQDDFDAWASFGNSGWGWNDLLPYFKRVRLAESTLRAIVAHSYQSETYTQKTYPTEAVQPVTPDPSVHGFSGPVQVSYPNYYWPQSGKEDTA
jgi:choline dehydrogenase-like flavoprotein